MIDENKKSTDIDKLRKNIIIKRIATGIIIVFVFILLSFNFFENINSDNGFNYMLFSLSIVLFLFGFIGIIIPKQFYSFIYKIGKKLLSKSNYENINICLNKKEYRYYNYAFIGISYILLIISILINVFN